VTSAVVTHVGHCVRDLERAERFYVDGLGFTRLRDLSPPEGITSKLLRVVRPVGLTAVYLGLGNFLLELLCFDRSGDPTPRSRAMTDPGLTHLSITVDDLPATMARLAEHGGEILVDTDVQLAVLVRDPDGQFVELVAGHP